MEITTHKGRVEGTVERGDGSEPVVVFKGIPYASPPTGALRFAAPVEHVGWSGTRPAMEFGSAPIQPDSPLTAGLGVGRDEDCLTLNIWTPRCDSGQRPVMVWLYGGGFSTGGSSISWYDGTPLARREVVVVTVNYRLGPLGFLHLEALGGERWRDAANLGLLDQAAALRWVHDNIEQFGGDPDNVTLFGESAGAMSVGTHLALPASQGRFHRAIAQSGAARSVHSADTAARIAEQVVAALGAGKDLDALRSLPAGAFAEVQASIVDTSGGFLPLPFQPTVDGHSLPRSPMEAVADGVAAGVELLVGTNLEEMRLWSGLARMSSADSAMPDESRLVQRVERALAARDLQREAREVVDVYRSRLGSGAQPIDVLEAVGTDLVFRIPAVELADAQGRHAAAFSYLFTHRSTSFGGLLGAAHAVEIPFVFDTLDASGTSMMIGDVDVERRSLALRMADCWTSFARTGDPSTSTDPWPRYEPDRRATKVWDTTPSVLDDPYSAERLVWTQ